FRRVLFRSARRGIAHLCGRLAHTLSTPRLRLDGSGDRLFIPGAPELLLARHLIRLVPGLGLLQALLALEDGVSQLAREKAHRPDRIVVARDDEVDLVRIAVGIDDGDDGDAQLPRFGDSDPLFAGVDDKDGIRQLLHIADAAQKAVEPFLLLARSEEHTSELQSREKVVCSLLLDKNIAQYDIRIGSWHD